MSYKVTVLLVLGLFGLVSYLLGSINFAIIVNQNFHRQRHSPLGQRKCGNDQRHAHCGVSSRRHNPAFRRGERRSLPPVSENILCLIFSWRFIPSFPEMMSAEGFAYASAVLPVYAANICGFFCILGHLYPIYFKFKGGKEFPPLRCHGHTRLARFSHCARHIRHILPSFPHYIGFVGGVGDKLSLCDVFHVYISSPAYDAITATAFFGSIPPLLHPS